MSDAVRNNAPSDREAGPVSLCVCVPARDEAQRLPALLEALAEQDWPGPIRVTIAVNNTVDDSVAVIETARIRHADRLAVRVAVADFAPAVAHAGSARRLAMSEGVASLTDLDAGILVSTDADARPPADWLRNIIAAFARGADLVGGRILIDEEREPLPAHVARLHRAWDRYWACVRAIEDRIDPVAWDPAPRHGDHTGASLAIRARLYLACGGVPLVPTGEDRALVDAAVAIGGRLAHPVNVAIRVSPRTDGRAEGGMAAAMQGLLDSASGAVMPMVPAFRHWAERAEWRRQLRHGPDGHSGIPRYEAQLSAMPHDMALETGQ